MDYINANTTPGKTDDESIGNAVRKAKETGKNAVVIPRHNDRTDRDEWLIENTVRLPDDIEILLDGAHLTLADGTFCNMFANERVFDPKPRTAADTQHRIRLVGRGNATLDGGRYNGLSERNSLKDGRPHISVNTTLLFVNVEDLRVENLAVVNQRWWGITNVFVTNAVFRNLRFRSDFTRLDKDGVHHAHEEPQTYEEVYIKNSDGIDLRVGCHDILIENISGFTEDDTVALTALGGFEKRLGYFVDDAHDPDIHDVTIRNVSSTAYCSNVRLLNDNGFKLYNVTVDGVTSHRRLSACAQPPVGGGVQTPKTPAAQNFYGARLGDTGYHWNDIRNAMAQNFYCVRIGDMAYAVEHARLGDTHHITVRNVISSSLYAVGLCKGLVDSTVENVTVMPGGKVGFGTPDGTKSTVENVKIAHIAVADDDAIPLYLPNVTGSPTLG